MMTRCVCCKTNNLQFLYSGFVPSMISCVSESEELASDCTLRFSQAEDYLEGLATKYLCNDDENAIMENLLLRKQAYNCYSSLFVHIGLHLKAFINEVVCYYVGTQSFFPRVILLCLFRDPQPQETQKAHTTVPKPLNHHK